MQSDSICNSCTRALCMSCSLKTGFAVRIFTANCLHGRPNAALPSLWTNPWNGRIAREPRTVLCPSQEPRSHSRCIPSFVRNAAQNWPGAPRWLFPIWLCVNNANIFAFTDNSLLPCPSWTPFYRCAASHLVSAGDTCRVTPHCTQKSTWAFPQKFNDDC